MKKDGLVRAAYVFVVATAIGLAGGALHAAVGHGGDENVTAVVTSYSDLVPTSPLPAHTRLPDGSTVGLWRLDTPLAERPDFVASQLEDGTPGYVKREDIDDGYVLTPAAARGEVQVSTPEEVEAAQRRASSLIQPNADGEIWAPLYAKDGVTVLGKVLMSSPDDQPD